MSSAVRRLSCYLLPAPAVLTIGAIAFFLLRRGSDPGIESRPPPIMLVVSGDTQGWIVPCGCTSNQSGGLLRRGSFLKELRERAEVVLLDAGGAPGGTSPYQRLKFEAILKGEKQMGSKAHNLGGPEAALGASYLRRVGAELGVTFLSANLRDDKGEFIAQPLLVHTHHGGRLAVTGVLSRRYASEGLKVDDPREAILKAIAEARGKYDTLVVLAYLPEDELRLLAAGLPEADIIVGGPTGQSISPRSLGPTLLASATNKGKFLIQLEPGSGGRWTGQVVEMDPRFEDDPDQEENLKSFLEELGQRDFAAAETGLQEQLPPALPKEYRIASNAACLPCHKADGGAWDSSAHAHAWETLTARGQHVDPFCQQCHTNGYGLPGGFESMAHSPKLVGVGCETCHGPSQAHVRDPRTKTSYSAQDQCVRCHDRENSPRFDYVKYWPRILHGARIERGSR
jgi:hypothetical protein